MSDRDARDRIVGRERELLGVSVILDPDLFCALVEARAPEQDLEDGELVRLRYTPGKEAVALFAFHRRGGRVLVHAEAVARAASRWPEDEPPDDPDGGRWRDEGLRVRIFPRDPVLPFLADLHERPSTAMAPLLPGLGADVEAVHTVDYEPGCWWVGRADVDGRPVASLKILEGFRFGPAYWNARMLPSREILLLPSLLGSSSRDHALASAWLHGRTLRSALGNPGLPSIMLEMVGAALAELHGLDPGSVPHCTRASETQMVRRLAVDLSRLAPETTGRLGPLADQMTRRLLDVPLEGGVVHGHLTPKRILLAGDRVAILEVDRACRGRPARDLGTVLAHLDALVLRGKLPQGVAERAGKAIVGGYLRLARRPPPEREVRLYRACALLRLAREPFRRLEPGWPATTQRHVLRAQEVVGDWSGAVQRPDRHAAPGPDPAR